MSNPDRKIEVSVEVDSPCTVNVNVFIGNE